MESGISRVVECLKNGLSTHSETKRKPSKLEDTSNEEHNTMTYVQVERKRLEAILRNGNLTNDTRVNLNSSPTSVLLRPPPRPLIKKRSSLPPPPPPPLLNITQLNLPLPLGCFPQPINRQRSVKIPKSSVPLKSLNWVKLPETKISGTIWADIDESKIYSSIDLETVDKLFYAHQNQKTKSCSVNEESSEDLRKIGKNKIVSVIDGRRAQNCTILLSKLKMSNEEISNMILNMDAEDVIPLDMIEQLLKFTPSPDEVVLLEEHSYELDTLGRAERFLYEISKIVHYEQRLRCLIYKKKFVAWTNEVEDRIKAVMEASCEVTCSRRLKKLLEIVLALGNYMNEGARGNAWGFRLSTLNRLADTKSSSIHGITLLHYIVDVVDRKFMDILLLNEEIPHVRTASKVSLRELEEDMKQLRNNLKDVEREIEFQLLQPAVPGDKFLSVMKEFLFIASGQFSVLENFFRDMNTKFDGAVRLFGENSSNTQPDDFFGIFVKFLLAFSEALQDNNNIKKRQVEKEKSLWQEIKLKNLTPDRKNSENENSVLPKTI